MVLRMPFCSAAAGIVRRRLAVRVRVVRMMRGRVRMRVSGGAVRYGDYGMCKLPAFMAITPAESISLAECQNTKRRGFPISNRKVNIGSPVF